jgi:hypothetical protein
MSTETQTTHATPAPDAVQPDERRKLALDAFNELDALLDLVPQVDAESLFALRGLTMRADDLLSIIYTAGLDLDPSPADLEDSRKMLYGYIRGRLGDGEE